MTSRWFCLVALGLWIVSGCVETADDDVGGSSGDDDAGDDDAGDDDAADDDVGDDDVADDDAGDDDSGGPMFDPGLALIDDVVDGELVTVEQDRLVLPLAGHEELLDLEAPTSSSAVTGPGICGTSPRSRRRATTW